MFDVIYDYLGNDTLATYLGFNSRVIRSTRLSKTVSAKIRNVMRRYLPNTITSVNEKSVMKQELIPILIKTDNPLEAIMALRELEVEIMKGYHFNNVERILKANLEFGAKVDERITHAIALIHHTPLLILDSKMNVVWRDPDLNTIIVTDCTIVDFLPDQESQFIVNHYDFGDLVATGTNILLPEPIIYPGRLEKDLLTVLQGLVTKHKLGAKK